MEISTILACPSSMGIMLWKMNRNIDDRHMNMKSEDKNHTNHIKKSEE